MILIPEMKQTEAVVIDLLKIMKNCWNQMKLNTRYLDYGMKI